MMNTTSKTIADSPTTNDLLGFKKFTELVAERIAKAVDTNSTPLTIGIYGAWGSGKTSFMMMVDENLQQNDIHPIWFNAWKYNQEENLWSALIQTILDQAKVRGNWYQRGWIKFRLWWHTINWQGGVWEVTKKLTLVIFRLIVFAISVVILLGWTSQEIQNYLTQLSARFFPNNPIIRGFFQLRIAQVVAVAVGFIVAKPDTLLKLFDTKLGIDFSKLRKKASYKEHIAFLDRFDKEFANTIQQISKGKPLVVIIDDLDRCLPEQALQVLEAVKLFLDVDNCVYLLAVDREVVEKAISVRYKDLLTIAGEMGDHSKNLVTFLGENYFEKIIQLPVLVPSLSEQQVRDFLSELYDDPDVKSCIDIFAIGLPKNPRKIKNTLQIFLFLRDAVRGEIISVNLRI